MIYRLLLCPAALVSFWLLLVACWIGSKIDKKGG